MSDTAGKLRRDVIMLVTAELGGHPLGHAELQALLVNQESAAYTVNLVYALVEGLAANLAQMAGSPEGALQALQAVALQQEEQP